MSDSEALAQAYRDHFPHHPQPRAPLSPGVSKVVEKMLKRYPLEWWDSYFDDIVRDGMDGWLWTSGNMEMLQRPSIITKWEMGQYRSPNLSSVFTRQKNTDRILGALDES